ncbi:MAG: hypothetical protein H7A33_05375 [Deltaproteobacteria bacterium]|nr:hypothetical protein [Deltaproteobacteria bacterium]
MKIISVPKTILFLLFTLAFLTQCQQGSDSSQESENKEPSAVAKQVDAELSTQSLKIDASMLMAKTIKNGDTPVSGSLNFSKGNVVWMGEQFKEASAHLSLASWNSSLALRDQRVRDIFFGVSQFGDDQLEISFFPKGKINLTELQGDEAKLVHGDVAIRFRGKLDLKRPAAVFVSKNQEGNLVVEIKDPVTVSISKLGLSQPLDKLIEICAHKSVDDQVEITGRLEFIAP